MADQSLNNGDQNVLDVTLSYISAENESRVETSLPPIMGTYYDDGGSWLFSSHDIPILIGAAAGAIGLILIFLAAVLIWHCCQFTLQREKSSYSLDDSEQNSVSSRASNLYINNPIIDEKSMVRENSDQNLKRSISAPIHRQNDNNGEPQVCPDRPIDRFKHGFHSQSNTQTPVFKANDFNTSEKPNDKKNNSIDDKLIRNNNSMSMELSDTKHNNDLDCHRSQMYVTNSIMSADMDDLRCKSLPWSHSNKKNKTVTIDVESQEELQPKINFSKKRKNRMRNDSAAAIALNRSGTIISSEPNNKVFHSHKDTDTLVDNEAIVVYDERTAL